jgi:hypothetical protein
MIIYQKLLIESKVSHQDNNAQILYRSKLCFQRDGFMKVTILKWGKR